MPKVFEAAAPFGCVVTRTGIQTVTVVVGGEIDIATIDEFRAGIVKARGSMPEAIDLDLRGVTFMGCSAMSLLADEVPKATRAGARVAIESTPMIDRLLRLIGDDGVVIARILAPIRSAVGLQPEAAS